MHASNDSADPGMKSDDHLPRRRRLLMGKAPRTRSVVVATGLLVVCIAPFGVAATGDSLREGRRNGTTIVETEVVSNIKSSTALKGGYSTRQSNLSDSGGGAIYGCRSQAGGSKATPTPQNPCVRANNLSRGLAFEFNSTIGEVAGAITVGSGGDAKKPFTTNATGVATGLNADRLDGASASELLAAAATDATMKANAAKTRWALVDESGDIIEQSGGFSVASKPGINGQPATNPNIYISVGSTLLGKGLTATVAIQNRIDRTGDAVADPAFSGDIAVGRCNTAAIACAPAGTNNDNTLVVRSLLDNTTVASQTRRFYVEVSD